MGLIWGDLGFLIWIGLRGIPWKDSHAHDSDDIGRVWIRSPRFAANQSLHRRELWRRGWRLRHSYIHRFLHRLCSAFVWWLPLLWHKFLWCCLFPSKFLHFRIPEGGSIVESKPVHRWSLLCPDWIFSSNISCEGQQLHKNMVHSQIFVLYLRWSERWPWRMLLILATNLPVPWVSTIVGSIWLGLFLLAKCL